MSGVQASPLSKDWRDRGLCIDLDPRDFDNGGTDIAHNACERCPVRAECLQDAHESPDPVWGVYRAGRWWGAKPKGLEERLCAKCERPLGRVRNRNGLLVYADRYCASCRRSMRPKVSLQTRIDQWNDYASQGIGLGRAASLMGIERHTLVGYLRTARRKGIPTRGLVDENLAPHGEARENRRAGTVRQHTSGPDRQSLPENERG